MKQPILIADGGLGGLTSALALAQRGIPGQKTVLLPRTLMTLDAPPILDSIGK